MKLPPTRAPLAATPGLVSRSGRPFPIGLNIPPRSRRSLPPGGLVSRSGRPFPTGGMRALAMLAAFVLAQVHAEGIPSLQPKLLPPEQAFRLSARALDPSTIEARFDIADGYYLYRDKLRFTTEPAAAGQALLPPGKTKHDAFFGDVDTYRGELVVRVPLTKSVAGETITLHADSQGCADVGVCYPPNPQQLRLVMPQKGGKPGAFVETARKGWFK
jgi:thiol:disulfide interchange protein